MLAADTLVRRSLRTQILKVSSDHFQLREGGQRTSFFFPSCSLGLYWKLS